MKNWDGTTEADAMPLPPEVAGLPTIAPEPWLLVDPDPSAGFLEGPAFDRQGNLYVTQGAPGAPKQRILKVAPDKAVSEFWSSTTIGPTGIAIHKDGRFFMSCMTGELLILKPDGTHLQALRQEYGGRTLALNDLVFDKDGNVYFTDFSGNFASPVGGVYRLDASSNYTTLHLILGNLAGANGISLSPSGETLWVAETCRNGIVRIDLMPDGLTPRPLDGVTYPFYSTGGPSGPDSNKVDAKGNLYQCFNFQGRAVILNRFGVPIANVIIQGREEGRHLCTTNVALKPGTDEAYIEASGDGGAWIYKFKALAPALTLYSHQ